MTIFIDRHPADALPLEVGQQLLQHSGERQVGPHGVRWVDHWREEGYLYCVLEAPNAYAVCQHHADRGVPCNDLHPVELRPGVPSVPAEDTRAVRAAIENIWHTSVGPYSAGQGAGAMNSPARASPGVARVLVVDDERHLLLNAVACTNRYQDFTVFGAHSRKRALQAVGQLADVLILDVTKPGLDGFGTLEDLWRRIRPGSTYFGLRPDSGLIRPAFTPRFSWAPV